MVSAGVRTPTGRRLRLHRVQSESRKGVTGEPPDWSAVPGHNGPRASFWILPLIAGAVLALLVALLTARVGYAGTVLIDVYYSREWTTANQPLVTGADLGYTTKNYVRLAVYAAEPLSSLRIGTLSLPVATLDKDYTVDGAVYRYPATGKDAVAVLRPGKNTVTVSARGTRLTESLKFYVTYVATPVQGAEYFVADLGAARQVTAFDKALQFSTPAGTVVLDGTEPAGEQWLRWTVEEPPTDLDDLPPGFRPVSKVFGLEFADSRYNLSAEPTLVLKYDPSVSATTAAQMLTVFVGGYSDDFYDAENLGGVVDTRNAAITVKLDRDCGEKYYCVFLGLQNFEEFLSGNEDVAWSYAYIMPLWARGIMEAIQSSGNVWGYTVPGGGYFGLVQSSDESASEVQVSRGEFTVMMAKAMGYRPVEMNPLRDDEYSFEDVCDGAYAYAGFTNDADRQKYGPWIETAARNGLVTGFPPVSSGERPIFDMKLGLAREQAAAILARAAGLTLSDDRNAVDTALRRAFTDWDKISPWARPYVLAAYRAKYIEGVPETTAEGKTTYKFEPERALTRAEAAKLVYFVARKNKKL